MFIVKNDDAYWWPVTIKFPAAGSFTTQTFEALFKVLPASRVVELSNGTPVDILKEALLDWKGIVDEERNDIAFNEDVRDQLLDNPFFIAALAEALTASFSGRRVKN